MLFYSREKKVLNEKLMNPCFLLNLFLSLFLSSESQSRNHKKKKRGTDKERERVFSLRRHRVDGVKTFSTPSVFEDIDERKKKGKNGFVCTFLNRRGGETERETICLSLSLYVATGEPTAGAMGS